MARPLSKPEYFWPALWGGACAVLAGVIGAELYFGQAESASGAAAPARVVEAKLLKPFALPPEAVAGTETTGRPLFLPGRRPAPPATAADAAVMKKGQYVLQGTTVVGDLAFAMLKEVAGGKVHRVQKGARLNDLTLSEVGPTHAVLTLGSDSENIPLLVAKATPQQAAAAAAAAGGPFGGAAPAQPRASGARPPAQVPIAGGAARPAGSAPVGFQPTMPTQPPAAASAPIPRLTPDEDISKLTPEEILARRRAARRAQATN